MNQLILPYQKNIKQTFENYYSDSDLNTQISEGIKNIFSNLKVRLRCLMAGRSL